MAAYTDVSADAAARDRGLPLFDCMCPICVGSKPAVEISERRRERLHMLKAVLSDEHLAPAIMLGASMEMTELLVKEKLEGLDLAFA